MFYRQNIAFSLILPCGVVKLTPQGPRCPENYRDKSAQIPCPAYLSEKDLLRYRKINFLAISIYFGTLFNCIICFNYFSDRYLIRASFSSLFSWAPLRIMRLIVLSHSALVFWAFRTTSILWQTVQRVSRRSSGEKSAA
jgi:hypothetical protein